MTQKKLLAVKATLKRKQPVFRRQQAAIRKKLKPGYRRPRGLHSKMGLGIKGHPKRLAMGYRTPVAVRGMTQHGLVPVLVLNPGTLAQLDPKQHAVIVGKVGGRKKVAIIGEASAKGFTFVNASAKIGTALQERFAAKQQENAAAAKQRKASRQQAAAKADETPAASEEPSVAAADEPEKKPKKKAAKKAEKKE